MAGLLVPTIRHAKPADANPIISGINTICSEGGAFYTTQFVPTIEWNLVLYHPETVTNHTLVVAEWDQQIIGAGRLFSAGEYTFMNHTAELGLFVLKPFRRQGIGTGLMNWLLHWAVQRNIEKVTLVVFSTNGPAINFFNGQGFVQAGRMQKQLKTSSGYIDLLLMELFLP